MQEKQDFSQFNAQCERTRGVRFLKRPVLLAVMVQVSITFVVFAPMALRAATRVGISGGGWLWLWLWLWSPALLTAARYSS